MYWVMIALLVLRIYDGAFAAEQAFVSLVINTAIPGIWFFFAGKVSDRLHQHSHHSTQN